MKPAFIFPGQGAQKVGMGKELYDNFIEVRDIFDTACEVLGYDIKSLIFEGPKEELNKTFKTQPALIVVSISILQLLTKNGLYPSLAAGHSLGEYSALVAAGVLDFKDALILTEKRGRFMQEAVPEEMGLMAAILGLDRESVDNVCLDVEAGYVSPANYNCPGQIVIAGEKQAVEEAMMLAKEAGAKRTMPLKVSVPSHCTLMVEASEKLGELFNTIEFKKPDIPIVNNADAMLLTTLDSIKDSLIRQLNSPLLWEDSVNTMIDAGIDCFIEVGPGTTLTGLLKKIDPKVKSYNVNDAASLERILAAFK